MNGGYIATLNWPAAITETTFISVIVRPIGSDNLDECSIRSGTIRDFRDSVEMSLVNSDFDFADFIMNYEDGVYSYDVGAVDPCVVVITSELGLVARLFLCPASSIPAAKQVVMPVGLIDEVGNFMPPAIEHDSPDMAFINFDTIGFRNRFVCFNPPADRLVAATAVGEQPEWDVHAGQYGIEVDCGDTTGILYYWQEEHWLASMEI